MSGVGITGKIVPLNGGTFPVFEDINGQGGLRSVADIPARNAVAANPLFCKEGMLVYVLKTKCIYALEADLVTWTIIANVNLGSQATWFIDPVNGDDTNDGITLGTAIKTATEFRDRCFPFGSQLILKTDVTVTIVAASAQTITQFFCNYGTDSNALHVVNVVGQVSSTANITLSGVTQIAASTKTRGSITTLSGTFVSGELIRVTSGTNVGALAYSMGLNGGATSSFVTNFGKDAVNNDTWPAVNDTVVVDTLLVSIPRVEVYCSSLVQINIKFFKITAAEVMSPAVAQRALAAGGGNVSFIGCQQTSATGEWVAPCGATLIACRTISTARIAVVGALWMMVNHFIQGVFSIAASSATAYGIFGSGGNLFVGDASDVNHQGNGGSATLYLYGISASNDRGAVEFENGPGIVFGAALTVGPGSRVINDSFRSQMWGAIGGYALGFQFIAGGKLNFSNNSITTVINDYMQISATNAIDVAGIVFPTYSNNPIMLRTMDAGIFLEQSNGLQSEAVPVYATGQTANIATTQLLAANRASKAMYRFKWYLAPTHVGSAGNLTMNAIFTDDSGTLQTLPVGNIDNTVLSGKGGTTEIECNGTTAISFSVTGFTAGLIYNARVGCELDSWGSL